MVVVTVYGVMFQWVIGWAHALGSWSEDAIIIVYLVIQTSLSRLVYLVIQTNLSRLEFSLYCSPFSKLEDCMSSFLS